MINLVQRSIIALLIFFNIQLGTCQSSTDSLVQFAKINPSLFWHVVSKHYPFDKPLIDSCQDNLSFHALSFNKNVFWTSELIREYEPYWAHDFLLRNPAIIWDETRLTEFMSREWFEVKEVYFNRPLTLSRKFFDEVVHKKWPGVSKNIISESTDSLTLFDTWIIERNHSNLFSNYVSVASWEDSIEIYQKLQPHLNHIISDIPFDTLMHYHRYINWYNYFDEVKPRWTWEHFDKIHRKDDHFLFNNSDAFYENCIQVGLNNSVLLEINRYFNDSIKYALLRVGGDVWGDLPNVLVDNYYDMSFSGNFQDSAYFPDNVNPDAFYLGQPYEGPIRFADYFELTDGLIPVRAISSRMKDLLSEFVLPPHVFYPIQLRAEDQWYGRDTMDFYILLLEKDHFLSYIEYDSIILRENKSLFRKEISPDDLAWYDITDPKTYKEFQSLSVVDPLFTEDKISVGEIVLKEHFDMLTGAHGYIWVSARLGKAMKQAGLTGVNIRASHTLNIRSKDPDTEIYEDSLRNLLFNIKELEPVFKEQRNIRDFINSKNQYRAALNDTSSIAQYYSSIHSEPDELDAQIMDRELKWNVLLPSSYKSFLKNGVLPASVRSKCYYFSFSPLEKHFQATKDFTSYVIQTTKGIIFAKNELGDSLMFILKPGSTFELDNMVYMVNHETAELTPLVRWE